VSTVTCFDVREAVVLLAVAAKVLTVAVQLLAVAGTLTDTLLAHMALVAHTLVADTLLAHMATCTTVGPVELVEVSRPCPENLTLPIAPAPKENIAL
jgi:hypothetical protein